jgi:hypothetical protein
MLKDPIKDLWVPFWINLFAVVVNVIVVVLGAAYSENYFWIANVIAATFSAAICGKELAKIPQRKRELQDQLIGYLKRG